MLDEMFDGDQNPSNIIKMRFSFFFEIFIFFQILRWFKPVQNFIHYHKNGMLDEMLDWFAGAFSLNMMCCF